MGQWRTDFPITFGWQTVCVAQIVCDPTVRWLVVILGLVFGSQLNILHGVLSHIYWKLATLYHKRVDVRSIKHVVITGASLYFQYMFGCRPLSYPDSDVILICFSIVSPDSLGNVIEKWIPEVSHFCPKVPVILIGTKKDLRNDAGAVEYLSLSKEKPVTTEQGQQVAALIKAYAYLECSSRTREGVQQVFETATLASLHKHKSRSSSRAKCRILWFHRVFVLHLNCCIFSYCCYICTRLWPCLAGQFLHAHSHEISGLERSRPETFTIDGVRFFTG